MMINMRWRREEDEKEQVERIAAEVFEERKEQMTCGRRVGPGRRMIN